MSNYYPTLSNQMSTQYVGEQKLPYPELPNHPDNTMMYLNQVSSAGSYSEIFSRSGLSPQNHVEIPSVGNRNEMMFIPPIGDSGSTQSIGVKLNTITGPTIDNSVSEDPPVVLRTYRGVIDDDKNFQCQGLSLSLGTEMLSAISVPSLQYQYPSPVLTSFPSTHLPFSGKGTMSSNESNQTRELRNSEYLPSGFAGKHGVLKGEDFCNPPSSESPNEIHYDPYSYEYTCLANTVLSTKYLMAAQQLLDEVVNVRQALKQPGLNKYQNDHGIGLDGSKDTEGRSMLPKKHGTLSSESITNSSCELLPAERQDLQNKKTKLLSMLDEVDRRYKQYYHQMQTVVSSLDNVAGYGAAKPYTALALQTISRHFRCLRDAISGQIQIIRKSLGEQDKEGGIPRLRYVDHQLRQQRALQQFGVTRHAWRPQRGLSESSVSILRAWLFEHFLHPYPKDSEKIMLARQTGLTRNQVANWFINARVRLWKPMVEEIYKEEFDESTMHSNSSLENTPKVPRDNSSASDERGEELQDSVTSASADRVHIEKNRLMTGRTTLHGGQTPNEDDHSLMTVAATYNISELSGLVVNDQVSLALGLQHCDNNNQLASPAASDMADYPYTDGQEQQHRFGNPQLLHDFVV